MMRLIDADALYKPVGQYERLKYTYEYGYVVQKYDIDHAPTIDAIEVVRCKDCKNWDTSWISNDGFYYCPMIDRLTPGDFFCADGERREDA